MSLKHDHHMIEEVPAKVLPVALVAEDEPQMAAIIAFALETQGFDVRTVHNGAAAKEAIDRGGIDLAVLDVMLPRCDGFELCRHIRRTSSMPVLLLTARTAKEDVIAGLEAGADDYVAKPFHPRELALRANALLRRSQPAVVADPIAGPTHRRIAIDRRRHVATLDGEPLHLTNNEFKLLFALVSAGGEVRTWQQLLSEAWGLEGWEGGREMVKAAVYRLRHKLGDDPAEPVLFEAVRGVGYRMLGF